MGSATGCEACSSSRDWKRSCRPRSRISSAIESMEVPVHPDEHLLHQIFGFLPISNGPVHEIDEPHMVSRDQLFERSILSSQERLDHGRVFSRPQRFTNAPAVNRRGGRRRAPGGANARPRRDGGLGCGSGAISFSATLAMASSGPSITGTHPIHRIRRNADAVPVKGCEMIRCSILCSNELGQGSQTGNIPKHMTSVYFRIHPHRLTLVTGGFANGGCAMVRAERLRAFRSSPISSVWGSRSRPTVMNPPASLSS